MAKKKADISEEQHQLLIKKYEAERGFGICGYPSYDIDGNIKICRLRAGFGTNHVGEGMCRLHGGVGRPSVTGKGSKYLKQTRTVNEFVSQWNTIKYQVEEDYTESVKLTDALVKYVQTLKNRDVILNDVVAIIDSVEISDVTKDILKEGISARLQESLTGDVIYQVEAIRRLLETKYKLLKSQIDLLNKESNKR